MGIIISAHIYFFQLLNEESSFAVGKYDAEGFISAHIFVRLTIKYQKYTIMLVCIIVMTLLY